EGVLHGKVTGSVRRLYRRWGVETDRVPDHFAVEAAFLAGLLAAVRGDESVLVDEDAPEARSAPRDESAPQDLEWLASHLRSWAPAFLRRVEIHDRTGFWTGAARWARELLEELEAG
ncbi:MAG TPA: molecular chaperone TorD family protein, partial [Longimicrobiales bacterium]|nr:molecular chaperone TorD family protein [Longimicrobiales bacterium]